MFFGCCCSTTDDATGNGMVETVDALRPVSECFPKDVKAFIPKSPEAHFPKTVDEPVLPEGTPEHAQAPGETAEAVLLEWPEGNELAIDEHDGCKSAPIFSLDDVPATVEHTSEDDEEAPPSPPEHVEAHTPDNPEHLAEAYVLEDTEAHIPSSPERPAEAHVLGDAEAHIPSGPEAPPAPEVEEARVFADAAAQPAPEPAPEIGCTWGKSPDASAEIAPAEAAAETDEDGLSLTFLHDGHVSEIVVRMRPLGFRFMSKKPFVVVSFVHEGRHAECVGVRVGMQLIAINGVSTEGWTSREVLAKLQVETANLETEVQVV